MQGVERNACRRGGAVIHLGDVVDGGCEVQFVHRECAAGDRIPVVRGGGAGTQVGHTPVVVACFQEAATGQVASGGHCGFKTHGGAGIVRAAPLVARSRQHGDVVQVGAVAVGCVKAVLRGHVAGFACRAGGAVAVGVVLRGDGDQQFVGCNHLQIALLHGDRVVAVLRSWDEVQAINRAVVAYCGGVARAGVSAVGRNGHLHQGGGGVVCALQAGVTHAGVDGGAGVLGHKSLGIAHLDGQCCGRDGAHIAAGRSGQGVVGQQGTAVGRELAGSQCGRDRARPPVGIDMWAGVSACGWRDACAFSADPTGHVEVARAQSGVGGRVIDFADRAFEVGRQSRRRDAGGVAGAGRCQSWRLVVAGQGGTAVDQRHGVDVGRTHHVLVVEGGACEAKAVARQQITQHQLTACECGAAVIGLGGGQADRFGVDGSVGGGCGAAQRVVAGLRPCKGQVRGGHGLADHIARTIARHIGARKDGAGAGDGDHIARDDVCTGVTGDRRCIRFVVSLVAGSDAGGQRLGADGGRGCGRGVGQGVIACFSTREIQARRCHGLAGHCAQAVSCHLGAGKSVAGAANGDIGRVAAVDV